MKVLHLVGGDLNNGAAIGVMNLHKALLQYGVSSTVLCYSGKPSPGVILLNSKNLVRLFVFANKLFWFLLKKVRIIRPNNAYIYNFGLTGVPYIFLKSYVAGADVVNLHWLGSTFPLSIVQKIKKPIVWTVRDMWPLTGGCHYSNECDKYTLENGCFECPAYESLIQPWMTKRSLEVKIAVAQKVHYVGISDKITQQLSASSITNRSPITFIPNLVLVDNFAFLDSKSLKVKYGLDLQKPTLLLGARNVADIYKGYISLEKHICKLRHFVQIVTFGNGWESLPGIERLATLSLGRVNDSKIMNELYGLSDLYVMPSLQEAYGKSLVEAQLSGTFVMAFNDTGCADAVFSPQTGKLISDFNFDSMVNEINSYLNFIETLDSSAINELKSNIASTSREFSNKRNVEKNYVDLYHALTNLKR